jgi:hypothetical protein
MMQVRLERKRALVELETGLHIVAFQQPASAILEGFRKVWFDPQRFFEQRLGFAASPRRSRTMPRLFTILASFGSSLAASR